MPTHAQAHTHAHATRSVPPKIVTSWTTPVPTAAGGLGIQFEVIAPVSDHFLITAEPRMPEIQFKASAGDWVAGTTPGGGALVLKPWQDAENRRLTFTWNVAVDYKGVFSTSLSTPIGDSTGGGEWTLRFAEIRGGNLTVTAKTIVKGQALSLASTGLWVGGSDPTVRALAGALAEYEMLKRMARLESALHQFSPGSGGRHPLFSKDRRGVGLLQISNPTPGQIWNWRENVAAGIALFEEKKKTAAPYVKQCQHSKQFKDLVTQYNKARTDAGKKPLAIALDDFGKIDREWLDDDAIRGFNGYGGTDSLGQAHSVHEFEVPVDAGKLLVHQVDEKNLTAIVGWRRTPISRRYTTSGNPIGDPDYVNDIKRQASF